MNSTPIYYRSGSYARSAGELDAYRDSFRKNVATRDVIDKALRKHFDGMRLNSSALDDVLAETTPDRVALVLAVTMANRRFDGRFTEKNRTWGCTVRIPDTDPNAYADLTPVYTCGSHSVILNGFIDLFRRYIEA